MLHGEGPPLQFTTTLKEVSKLDENSVGGLKSAQRGCIKLRRPPPDGCEELRNTGCARLGLAVPGQRRYMHMDDVSHAEDRAKVLPGCWDSQVEARDVHIRSGLATMKVDSERLNTVVFQRS